MIASATRFSGALRLHDWTLIQARGADSASFLQGQLSNDLLHLPQDSARLAAYCSPKGRMIASMICWREGDENFALACSADLLAPTLKRLSMFVMRARCRLSAAGDEWALWGMAGAAAEGWLGAQAPAEVWGATSVGAARVVRLPDALGQSRFFWSGPSDQAPTDIVALEASAWRWLEVESGVVRIVAATVEAFVPQMVNFEVVGGVDFKKGCYPGQEVVARSQYRGTLKRRAMILACAQPMQEGQDVFSALDREQPAGKVALAASLSEGEHRALVEMKLAALGDGAAAGGEPEAPDLRLGEPDGPHLQVCALPYALPSDAA